MTNNEKLLKQIKKNIYGKLQAIKIISPPGFLKTVLNETQEILNDLCYPQKSANEISIINDELYIYNIHMITIAELLLRSQCATDIRLIIFQGKTINKTVFEKKCQEIPWEYFIAPTMHVKVKVDSIASKMFHEKALKKILTDILAPITVIRAACSRDSEDGSIGSHGQAAERRMDEETIDTTIYADLFKNKLTLSISLAGEPLYKRGYRVELPHSAPLREDIAACCMREALQWGRDIQPDFSPSLMFIPFAGTGTFAWEYQGIYSVLLDRKYSLEKMPLFKKESFQFLVKKITQHILLEEKSIKEIVCLDTSNTAIIALKENLINFNNKIIIPELKIKNIIALQEDFFNPQIPDHIAKQYHSANIFMPLNPPYGIRLAKQSDSVKLYKNIALQINAIAKVTNKNMLGFILCPSKETWSIFLNHLKNITGKTYHMTQGGLDIRVFQFFISK